jgi:hypothetical protein
VQQVEIDHRFPVPLGGGHKGTSLRINARGKAMMVYDERVKKFVRKPYPSKPIGNGRNAGTTRSMKQGTDIQAVFKAKIGVNRMFHKWS